MKRSEVQEMPLNCMGNVLTFCAIHEIALVRGETRNAETQSRVSLFYQPPGLQTMSSREAERNQEATVYLVCKTVREMTELHSNAAGFPQFRATSTNDATMRLSGS